MTAPIVHVVPDSPFLSFTAGVFEEAAPGLNAYFVFRPKGDLGRHAMPPAAHVELISSDAEGTDRLSRALAGCRVVIAHSMGTLGIHAVLTAPRHSLTVWSGWGGDYYGSDLSPMSGLLGRESRRYYRSGRTLYQKTKGVWEYRRAKRILHDAARASDVFSAPVPDDLDVFRRRYPEFAGRYGQLNYASVEDTYAVGTADVTGDDILIGNSASLPNNHFEVMTGLARLGTGDRRVIVPLSYGDPRYADAVVERGIRLFGSRFVALRDFLPLEEYQRVIAGCGVMLMGHHRQQGLGNVASALWSGAHVFLDHRSPMGRFFRAQRASVGTLTELWSGGLPPRRMPDAEREANRLLLRRFWGRDVVVGNARVLVESAGL